MLVIILIMWERERGRNYCISNTEVKSCSPGNWQKIKKTGPNCLCLENCLATEWGWVRIVPFLKKVRRENGVSLLYVQKMTKRQNQGEVRGHRPTQRPSLWPESEKEQRLLTVHLLGTCRVHWGLTQPQRSPIPRYLELVSFLLPERSESQKPPRTTLPSC